MKKIFKIILNTIPRPLLIRLSYVIRPLIAFLLKGNKYTDPIDGKSFKTFLPYGYKKQRNNVLSPSTLSLERHRLLWLYLVKETDFFTNKQSKKVLHFAPEQCFYKKFKNLKTIDYTTVDLNSPLADIHADICDLPFQNDSYDTIFCNHVLEHIPDDTKAMNELFRVLKPGGMAILQVPQDITRKLTFEDNTITNHKERTRIFGQYDHVRVYGYDYFNKLRVIGFKVEESNFVNKLKPELIEKYGLNSNEILPICFKH